MQKSLTLLLVSATVISGCSRAAYESTPIITETDEGAVTCQLYTGPTTDWDQAVDFPATMEKEKANEICRDVGSRILETELVAVLKDEIPAKEKEEAPRASAPEPVKEVEEPTQEDAPSAEENAKDDAPFGTKRLQLGSFGDEKNADKTLKAFEEQGITARKEQSNKLWRVFVPEITSKEALSKALSIAKDLGLTDAFATDS